MQDSLAPAAPASPKPADASAPEAPSSPHGTAADKSAPAAHLDERPSWIEALKNLLERAEACVVRNFRVPPGAG